MAANPLDPGHLFGHVEDSTDFHVPEALAPAGSHGHIEIWQPFKLDEPIFGSHSSTILPFDFVITKFMVLEVIVAVLIALFFIGLASHIRGGERPRGRWWNMLEVMLLFIRDQVARPCIGKEEGDRFVPFLWTMFFFVLGCNLMGMIPWLGSPTGALATTGALALITFGVVISAGVKKLGGVGFLKAQVPHMDLPKPVAIFLVPMIFVIELLGMLIKHGVLAVRLLANMMAGHVVLAVIIAFIAAAGAISFSTFLVVAPASVLGATALSLLELFVAFLQAYIFTFLSALFIGMAVHPH